MFGACTDLLAARSIADAPDLTVHVSLVSKCFALYLATYRGLVSSIGAGRYQQLHLTYDARGKRPARPMRTT